MNCLRSYEGYITAGATKSVLSVKLRSPEECQGARENRTGLMVMVNCNKRLIYEGCMPH